jgi:hypothetical protein
MAKKDCQEKRGGIHNQGFEHEVLGGGLSWFVIYLAVILNDDDRTLQSRNPCFS